jgi:hypothetical protein
MWSRAITLRVRELAGGDPSMNLSAGDEDPFLLPSVAKVISGIRLKPSVGRGEDPIAFDSVNPKTATRIGLYSCGWHTSCLGPCRATIARCRADWRWLCRPLLRTT